MKLIQWLKQLLKKPVPKGASAQKNEFVIVDAQRHIHTKEKIDR